ncbi:MAG: GNAT family N-acetyltransferase [Polyangiaceae bacterium]
MAALTTPGPDHVVVRAPRPGEGAAVARLWRELWNAHEGWGSYEATRDDRVYDSVADRLEYDARARSGSPVLGRHVHLVAARGNDVVGQVEGWIERQGVDRSTPHTCEVRSLVVRTDARIHGVGRALLAELADVARIAMASEPIVLAAEVLDPNPARAFYERVGYRPVSWITRFGGDARPKIDANHVTPFRARAGRADDALAVAFLDGILAARRRSLGDARFDRPRTIDASLVSAIAAHLHRLELPGASDAREIVVVDGGGDVRAVATLVTGDLLPPFAPARRALLGRLAIDPAMPVRDVLVPLVAFAWHHARMRGALAMEVTDLPTPGSPLYDATVALGAVPWSRIVIRDQTGPRAVTFER